MTMRVAFFAGAGQPIAIRQVAEPRPGIGEVLLKIGRCGICGSDISMTAGGPFDYPAGCTMGHEYAGEVVELGAGIERLRVGDHVACVPTGGCGECPACRQGRPLFCVDMRPLAAGFADFIAVPERSAVVLPESLSMADGALVEPMACGRRALHLAGFSEGQRLLVLGGGTMALSMIFWARLLGAAEIRVLSRSAHRREIVLAMGADTYHSSDTDDPEQWSRARAGQPDVVAECVGKTDMLGEAIDLVRLGGTVISMGMCTLPEPLVAARCSFKEVKLVFPLGYSVGDFEMTARAFDADDVDPSLMVSETIALEALPDTLERLRAGSKSLKVLVDPSLHAI
jgi:threonine dehydrogenase-like Zn-dependent dehydrogenase